MVAEGVEVGLGQLRRCRSLVDPQAQLVMPGESAPVVREAGGDRSSVTGGTTVLSDQIVVEITTRPEESFVDRMIALVRGAERHKTPDEIALTILLAALRIVFPLAVVATGPMSGCASEQQSPTVLTARLVCLIPTTIGALLPALGIAGMERLVPATCWPQQPVPAPADVPGPPLPAGVCRRCRRRSFTALGHAWTSSGLNS